MLKWTDFCIGGYNFDSYSDVTELYLPANVSSSTTKTLHVRGREALEHHLQHYAVPTDKVFIGIRAVVTISNSQTLGIFGTATRYLAQGAPDDWVVGGSYWYGGTWGTLVIHEDIVYECLLTHIGSEILKPPNVTYWTTGSTWAEDWENEKYYFMNQIVTVEVSSVSGSYRCTADHISSLSTKPCDEDWATKWDAGDEFIADRTISKYGLSLANGTDRQFGVDILGIFPGFVTGSNVMGRWLEAKTSSGTMLSGGVLYGVEIDLE